MITEHADMWSPSGSPVWVNCKGQPEMLKKIPKRVSSSGDEGEAAHWYCEQVLIGKCPPIGSTAPNDIIISQDIIDYCQIYIDLINATPGYHNIEQRIDIPSIHPGCFGTPDHWCYNSALMELYVDDLKYGWGLVESWWQHTCYASGILDKLNLPRQNIVVVMRTIQPRPWHSDGPKREWRIKASDLEPYIKRLHEAANDVFPTLCSGPWCKNCEAAIGCPANVRAAFNAVDVSEYPVDLERTNIGREISILKRAKEAIKNRLSAVEAEAENALLTGGFVEGWTMGPSKGGGKSTWILTPQEVVEWGQLFGVDLSKNSVITPIQAIKKGIPESFVKANCKMPKQGVILTKMNTERIKQIFEGE